MKKLVSVLLVLTMILGLAACGEKDNKEPVTYGFIEETLGTETYSIAFRKGDTENKEMIEAGFKAIVENGTYAKIVDEYPDVKDFISVKKGDFAGETLPEAGSFAGKTFTQGFDEDFPPYSYLKDDGTVGGLDVDTCKAICEYLGVEYKALPFLWDAKDAELNAKNCDCIWSGLTYEGREDDYLWGPVYSKNTQMILVGSDSGIKTLADLKGKIVGVQIATSALDMLEDGQKELADTFKELKTYETYTIAYSDLKAGAIDAIAIDVTTGTFLMANDAK